MVALSGLTASSATATFPGRNGRIVVEQTPGAAAASKTRVWTISPDGSRPRLLRHVHGPGPWSPDGRRLLLVGPCRASAGCGNTGANGPNELDTVDARGGHLRRIRFRTPGRWGFGPFDATWSPNGARLLFMRGEPVEGGDRAIFVSAANGRHQRLLLAGSRTLEFASPRFSPDGRRIAFAEGGQGLYVMNSDGSDVHALFPCRSAQGCSVDAIAWSPDGRTLAFAGGRPDFPLNEKELQVVDSQGGAPRVVRPGTAPFWSPDGKQLGSLLPASGSLKMQLLGPMSLQIGNADGTALRTVRQNVAFADWQPLP
jgi:Tol biopolymer transport system component